MDKLTKTIAEKKAEVEGLRSRIAVLEAEVSALELADRLRPIASSGSDAAARGRGSGGGRRPGDISHAWRGILKCIHDRGSPVGYDDIERIARGEGHELALSSIRDRVRNFVKTGLMSGDAQSGFNVTQDAAERFGFAKRNEPPSGGSETGEGDASPDPSKSSLGMFTYAPKAADPALHGGREGG